jgi:hypothetical protein
MARGQSVGDDRTTEQPNTGQLKAKQVVENLVFMNLQRARALQAYESTRIYRLEYKGFPGGRSAEMVVNMKYRAPGTKAFEIVSQSGSKMLIDRVFKKLMEGEIDAIDGENQKRIAVNQENYEFSLAGYEPGPRGCTCFPQSRAPKTNIFSRAKSGWTINSLPLCAWKVSRPKILPSGSKARRLKLAM